MMGKVSMLLAMSVLTGCGAKQAIKPDRVLQQNIVENRYTRAQLIYKQKMAPIAQYLVKVCGPQEDKAYLACIDGKRDEIAALSIYPENAAIRQRRQALENQLLAGQLDRKAFRAGLERLKAEADAERLKRDVEAGVYSGRY